MKRTNIKVALFGMNGSLGKSKFAAKGLMPVIESGLRAPVEDWNTGDSTTELQTKSKSDQASKERK